MPALVWMHILPVVDACCSCCHCCLCCCCCRCCCCCCRCLSSLSPLVWFCGIPFHIDLCGGRFPWPSVIFRRRQTLDLDHGVAGKATVLFLVLLACFQFLIGVSSDTRFPLPCSIEEAHLELFVCSFVCLFVRSVDGSRRSTYHRLYSARNAAGWCRKWPGS